MAKKQEQVLATFTKDAEQIIISEPELNLADLNNKLKEKYGFTFTEDQFIATGSEDPENPDIAIIDRRYDEGKLNILEDVHTNDWTASECIEKKAHFMWGKHGKTVLDTTLEYSEDSKKRNALRIIYKNNKYTNTKMTIDKLNCEDDIDLHTKGIDGTISALVYGRAAIQIITGQVSKEELDSDIVTMKTNQTGVDASKMPTALKVLNSRRLGKIKVNTKTNRVIAVEYLDVKKVGEDGQITEAADDEKYIPIEQLIYIVNTKGNVSTNAQFTGVSQYESIINISMVKRIIMNQNIKEAAKTHYAGILIAKFDSEVENNVMLGWIANAAKAAGRWFAHKMNVAVQHFKVDTDLDKYSSLVNLIDNAIIRAIGIPSALVGYESVKYSNMEELLIAWREGELEFWRTWAKGWLQKYYLNPLFRKLLPAQEQTSIDVPQGVTPPEDKPPNPYEKEEQEEPPTENPELEEEEDSLTITDEDVKLSYEFHNISFLSQKEKAEVLVLVKNDLGIALTPEMILRYIGMDDLVEEVMANQEKVDEEKKKKQEEQLEVMREKMEAEKKLAENGGTNEDNPFYKGGFPMGRPINAVAKQGAEVAAAEQGDMIWNEIMLKTLKTINNKLESLN